MDDAPQPAAQQQPEPTDWSPEQLERIGKWVDEKWGKDFACPMCRASDWEMSENPACIPTASRSISPNLGNVYPCALFLCRNCGNTLAINAVILGLVGHYPRKEAGHGD